MTDHAKYRMAFAAVIMLFVATPAYPQAVAPGPFVVTDPAPLATQFVLSGPDWVPKSIRAQPDGSLKVDVSQAGPINIMSVKACPDDLAGCSIAVPFILRTQSGSFLWGTIPVVWKEFWIMH